MRGGRAGFIERRARLARHHAARHVMMPREPCSCHVAILSFHASTYPNFPRFSCTYPFSTQFSRAVLEVFRNSKWVMQHIAGKLLTSSFQMYKVCANRSSDERVMAPRSRGVGAFFVCFSGKDSGQTGDAIGEPRVPRRSWSRHLSNAPRLAGQLVASRKDFAREGGCPEGKICFVPSALFLKMSDLGVLGTVGKLALPTFARFRIRGNPSLGSQDMVPRTEATGVVLVRLRTVFRSGFRLDPVKSWRSESSTPCMSVSSFQRAWARGSTCCESGRLCAQAWQHQRENSGIFNKALFRRPVFTCAVDVAPDVGFRRSWCRRKAYATYFPKVQALHISKLGFGRYDLANGGRWNVPYAIGSSSD